MVVELKLINLKFHHEVELQNILTNKINFLFLKKIKLNKLLFFSILKIFLLSQFKHILTLNRNNDVNYFFINNNFFIRNGCFLKKIFIFNFFLNLKIGSFFLTRKKFKFLKKLDRKVIKR